MITQILYLSAFQESIYPQFRNRLGFIELLNGGRGCSGPRRLAEAEKGQTQAAVILIQTG
jgi:hypothetical protein